MFNPNDIILYGANGAYRVDRITEMDFKDGKSQYYVLQSLQSSSATVFVPLKSDALVSKMRPILSEEKVRQIIKQIPEEEPNWIDNERARAAAYREILLRGNHKELVQLIKGIYLHKKSQKSLGKGLHKVDEQILKDAEKLLYSEFAFVLDMDVSQILPLIKSQLS